MKTKIKNNYFIDWPEIDFDEIKDYVVDNRIANLMYKGIIVMLFVPQILIRAFYEILRFKA